MSFLTTASVCGNEYYVEYANAEETASDPALDMHRVLKSGDLPDTVADKSGVAQALLSVNSWMPYAAEMYGTSASLNDYIIVPSTIFLTDVPNANLAAFPFEEMSAWNPTAGRISYRTWKGKPCLSGDALVSTELGFVPIMDMQRRGAKRVLTKDGSAVVKAWYKTGYERTFNVETESGHKLRATGNHPFLVLNDKCILKWTNVEDLRVGDVVVVRLGSNMPFNGRADLSHAVAAVNKLYDSTFTFVSKTGSTFDKPKHQLTRTKRFPSKLTSALARLLGHLSSDGHVGSTVRFANTNAELTRDFERCFRLCFGQDVVTRKCKVRHDETRRRNHEYIYDSYCARKDVRVFLDALGMPAHNAPCKYVPDVILSAPLRYVRQYLRAYIECDGCISGHKLQIHSSSERMAHGLQLLIESLGFPARVVQQRERLWLVSSAEGLAIMNAVGTITSKRRAAHESWVLTHDGDGKCLDRTYFKGERMSRRVPHVVQWAKSTISSHATGSGRKRRYWDSLGNDVAYVPGEFDVGNMNQGALAKSENVEHLASSMGRLNPDYRNRLSHLVGGDFVFDSVRSISKNGVMEPVFDITTTASQFVANGVVVHNCHEEHANQDPTVARGMIFDSSMKSVPNYVGGLHRVVLLAGWDRNRFPQLCEEIANDRHGFSMGCWVADYTCSVCNASMRAGGCSHINPQRGVLVGCVGSKLVYRIAHGCTGFELSAVKSPAWRNAMAIPIG